ncbi:MAG: serine/threonine-protein kinase Nek [archaeon]|nr:serine/threonine-protein kinase Nek [archaeon]
MTIDEDSEEEVQRYLNEIKIFAKLQHKNLIQYKTSFQYKRNKYCIVMEYADDGDLTNKIASYKKAGKYIEENIIWNWFLQICCGLNYIHSLKIIHRDIKSQNIFMMKNGEVKLGDFGISKVLKNTFDFAQTSLGTPYFLSPEICLGKPYNFKCDIWMLGCVLYEMITLNRPFEGCNLPVLMKNILTSEAPEISSNYSRELRGLVTMLLKKKQEERPSLKDILSFDNVIEKAKEFGIDFSLNKEEKTGIINMPRSFTLRDEDNPKDNDCLSTGESDDNETIQIYDFRTNEVSRKRSNRLNVIQSKLPKKPSKTELIENKVERKMLHRKSNPVNAIEIKEDTILNSKNTGFSSSPKVMKKLSSPQDKLKSKVLNEKFLKLEPIEGTSKEGTSINNQVKKKNSFHSNVTKGKSKIEQTIEYNFDLSQGGFEK